MTLLRFEELTAREQRMVNRDVFSAIRGSGAESPYVVYARVLSSWGVMCTHPQTKRLYGGTRRFHSPPVSGRYLWFRCECCDALSATVETQPQTDVTKKKNS